MVVRLKRILVIFFGIIAMISFSCGSDDTGSETGKTIKSDHTNETEVSETSNNKDRFSDESNESKTLALDPSWENVPVAKNIILMISDGQGFGSVMAADYYSGSPAVYESFPRKYFMTTYSSTGSYDPEKAWESFGDQKSNPTDSAAAATALATGVKAVPLTVGNKSIFKPLKNIVEVASEQGKATGVVTSVPISHATPAGMVVHNIFRENYEEIANEMIYHSELDVIMGGGHPYYDNNGLTRSDAVFKYVGGEETYFDLTDDNGATARDGKSWLYIETLEEFERLSNGQINTDKLIGLSQIAKTLQQQRDGEKQIAYSAPFIQTVPTLEMMAQGALNILEKDEDGFFIMIEGGAIDWSNHDNAAGRMIEEENDFNNAVATVVDWIEDETNDSSWENTLLIVTADHETGYIWGSADKEFILVGDNGAGSMPEIHYHSKNYYNLFYPPEADGIGSDIFELLFEGHHSNLPVPFYAKGVGSDLFELMIDGVDQFYSEILQNFDPEFDGLYIDNTDVFAVMNAVVAPDPEKPVDGVWLKGDLHSHSEHSDGDSPVEEILHSVASKGLDFFALTEHDGNMFENGNYQNVRPSHWDDPDYQSDQIILLYGVEWTTGKGHANVWSSETFDYTELWRANNQEDAYAAMHAAHDQGALFSINHPTAYFCCPWEYEVDNDVDSIEIWNALYRIPNLNLFASHPFWDKELKKGRRMTGLGGSDTHNLNGIEAWAFGHGNPTTWVYAADESGASVIDALKAGRVSISWSPDAPRLEITADKNNDGEFETVMGEKIIQTGATEIQFKVYVHRQGDMDEETDTGQGTIVEASSLDSLVSGETTSEDFLKSIGDEVGIVVILKNGILFKVYLMDKNTNTVTFSDTPKTIGRTYYRAELFGKTTSNMITHLLYGNIQAMTNPIYVNFPKN